MHTYYIEDRVTVRESSNFLIQTYLILLLLSGLFLQTWQEPCGLSGYFRKWHVPSKSNSTNGQWKQRMTRLKNRDCLQRNEQYSSQHLYNRMLGYDHSSASLTAQNKIVRPFLDRDNVIRYSSTIRCVVNSGWGCYWMVRKLPIARRFTNNCCVSCIRCPSSHYICGQELLSALYSLRQHQSL